MRYQVNSMDGVLGHDWLKHLRHGRTYLAEGKCSWQYGQRKAEDGSWLAARMHPFQGPRYSGSMAENSVKSPCNVGGGRS